MIQFSELSKDDYVAIGRFFLGTGPIPECLASAGPQSLSDWRKYIDTLKDNPVTGGLMALVGFALYLRFRRDIQGQKAPFTSADAEGFLQQEAELLSAVFAVASKPLSRDSASDIAKLFRDMATLIEVAEAFPEGDDRDAWWAWLQLVGKTFPSLSFFPKGQQRTQRLHKLLWLFEFGSNRLTEIERYEVLERIGLTDAEIPSGDALRKMLSYNRLSRRRTMRGVVSKSPKNDGAKKPDLSGQAAPLG